MKLSEKAIKELRLSLREKYGEGVDIALDDDEINEIGVLILNTIASSIR
jgi:hypothetical protein